MADFVPAYAEECDPNNPRQFAAWALSLWPQIEKSQPYPPAPRAMLPFHSEHLWKLGFRFHPELAELVKVPGKDGWPVFVTPEEAEVLNADEPTSDQVQAEAMHLLDQIQPGLAAEIDGMTPEQKAKKAEELQSTLASSLEAIKKLQEHLGASWE